MPPGFCGFDIAKEEARFKTSPLIRLPSRYEHQPPSNVWDDFSSYEYCIVGRNPCLFDRIQDALLISMTRGPCSRLRYLESSIQVLKTAHHHFSFCSSCLPPQSSISKPWPRQRQRDVQYKPKNGTSLSLGSKYRKSYTPPCNILAADLIFHSTREGLFRYLRTPVAHAMLTPCPPLSKEARLEKQMPSYFSCFSKYTHPQAIIHPMFYISTKISILMRLSVRHSI